jgi:formylglycine-generating enzyme required for sulfatase activity
MGARRPEAGEAPGPNIDPQADGDESPVHAVSLDAFFMGKYEVTRGQWVRMSGEDDPSLWDAARSGGRLKDNDLLRLPVENVDWSMSDGAARRVGLLLPTEAQWEYGCRAGTGSVFFFGGEVAKFPSYGNIADKSYNAAVTGGARSEDIDDKHAVVAPVGDVRFSPNAFGLFDAHGNVWEWCLDWYGPYSPKNNEPGTGLRLVQGSRRRVFRGGSFINTAVLARSANRNQFTPEERNFNLGFRASAQVHH